jgi:lysophospholipase L1-like esterase
MFATILTGLARAQRARITRIFCGTLCVLIVSFLASLLGLVRSTALAGPTTNLVFQDNFNSLTLGALPGQNGWVTAGSAWTVIDDSGNKEARVPAGGYSASPISQTSVRPTDTRLKVDFKAASSNQFPHLWTRRTGSSVNDKGYDLFYYSDGNLYLDYIDGGAITGLTSVPVGGSYFTVGNWYTAEFEVVNDGGGNPVLKGWFYAQGGSRPSSPSLSYTDTSRYLTGSGYVALGTLDTQSDFDNVEVYSGDGISTTTTIGSSQNPSNSGSSIRLTATVSPSSATGSVLFKDAGVTIGSGALSNGSGSFTISTLASGSHSLTAVYAGNSSYSLSTSSTLSQIVNGQGPPTAPQNLQPTSHATQLNLAWTAPSSNGGSAISDYVIKYRKGSDPYRSLNDGISTGTSATITGLSAGTGYSLSVYAINASGTGAALTGSASTLNGNITITSPSRGVAGAPTTATIAIDRSECGETFHIPYIQTGATITVTATVDSIALPAGGGVKFVMDAGRANEQVLYSLSSPFSAKFTGLTKAEHTLDTYVVDASHVVQGGAVNHDQAVQIGIGDIYVAIGDSVTEGYDGTAYNVPPYTDWLNVPVKSTDNRNYPQCGISSGYYQDHWQEVSHHIAMNNELEAFLGYPVFILNEGVAGITSTGYITRMATTAWQNRIHALGANKWLLHLGINDGGGSSGFQANMQSIINTLESTYGATGQDIVLAVPSASSGWQPYIDNLISANNLIRGPDFNTFYANNTSPVLYVGVHPNVAGHVQMARLWAISIMRPQNVSLSQTGTTVRVAWSSLASVEPTIAGYKVKYGTSAGVYTTTLDVGNVTHSNINGLTPGQTYYVAVSGYDNDAYVANETPNSQESLIAFTTVTTTALVSNSNPSTYGNSITLTATVSPSSATGSITFKNGSTTIGIATLGHGSGSLAISSLAAGSHSLTAIYAGNSNYTGSTSNTVTQTVNQATSTTALASGTNPSTFGNATTLTATVTPSSATGSITFKDGSTTIGTATLGHGSGSLSISTLAAGSHSLSAIFAGNASASASTSNTVTQTVNAIPSVSSGNTQGGGGGGGGGGRRGSTPPIASTRAPVPSPSPSPTTTTGPVLSASKSRMLRALQRRAAALQKTIDRTNNVRTKTILQAMMRIVERAIARVSK